MTMAVRFRALGAALLIGGLLVSACTRYLTTPVASGSPAATQPAPALRPTATLPPVVLPAEGRQATLSEIVNSVQAKASAGSAFVSVKDGLIIGAGGQVQTGPDSAARVDLGESATIRLDANTQLRVENLGSARGSPLNLTALDGGRLWIAVHSGDVQVLMSLGVARLGGGFAGLLFNPDDPATVADDSLQFDCLTGPCSLQFKGSEVAIADGQRLTVKGDSPNVARAALSATDIQDLMAHNPGAGPAAAASASPASATPAAPASATAAATSIITAEASATATAAGPATPAATQQTATPVLGQHVVRHGESLFCIGRAYGVLPSAIAEASGLGLNAALTPGVTLTIPSVRWSNIPGGPVCERQFTSPFPPGPAAPFSPPVVIVPAKTPQPTGTDAPPTDVPTPPAAPTPVCNPPEYFDPSMNRCRIQSP
jgi:LysM repeat protein